MARSEFSATEFVKEHRATQAAVKKGEAKVCTAKGCACGNIPLDLDAFYRDKSQADGRSPWCKAKERAYNSAYYAGLKKVTAPKKGAIEKDKDLATFEKSMRSERVQRTRGTKSTTDSKRTPQAKATTKARKAARTAKKEKVTA